jgi:hypothetical protein
LSRVSQLSKVDLVVAWSSGGRDWIWRSRALIVNISFLNNVSLL